MNEVEQGPDEGSPDVADPNTAPGTTQAIDWDSEDNPWRKRFEDYRPEADRRATQLSQYEQALEDFRSGDPQAMRRAAAILKVDELLEIEDPEPESFDDPLEQMRAEFQRELADVKGQLTARQEADLHRTIEDRLSKLEGLDDDDKSLVLAQAMRMDPDTDGLPDIKAAHEALVARDQRITQQHEERWRNGKRGAPASIQPGTPATQQKNVADMSREEAIAWAAERLDAMNATD